MAPDLTIASGIRLPSGKTIPQLGFGVALAEGDECERSILAAFDAGYRHIDSAQHYKNEGAVGRAVIKSKIPREEVFLTTKYMPSGSVTSSEKVLTQLRKSLDLIDQRETGDRYIDLFLIHSPKGGAEGRAANWAALVQAQQEGWVKDIGVSNFGVAHLKALPEPKPAVNQIELHPWNQQRDIVEYCSKEGIVILAFCPLVRARLERLGHPVIERLCEKHQVDAPQILLRWSLQMGFVPLPKSSTPCRIQTNADVYGFSLDEEDMRELAELDEGARGACSWNPVNEP